MTIANIVFKIDIQFSWVETPLNSSKIPIIEVRYLPKYGTTRNTVDTDNTQIPKNFKELYKI